MTMSGGLCWPPPADSSFAIAMAQLLVDVSSGKEGDSEPEGEGAAFAVLKGTRLESRVQ